MTSTKLEKNDYTLTHIGGNTKEDNNTSFIKNQSKVIESRKDKYPANYEAPYNDMSIKNPGLYGDRFQPQNREPKNPEKYDEYTDFLYKKGLLDRDNVTRYYTQYLNVDSSLRNKIPKAVVNEWTTLGKDPFLFIRGTKNLFIKHTNHNFNTNDKISITGVKAIKRNLKIKITNTDTNNVVTVTTIINFTKGSEYMTINVPHRMIFNNDVNIARKYDITGLFVDIAGVKGFPGNAFIENIPINTINATHQIYLIDPNNPAIYSDNKFYIKLIRPYTGESTSFLPDVYNFSITFQYIAGIPINKLNSEYPIDPNHQQGYLLIKDTTINGYYIELQKISTTIDANVPDAYSGGSNIDVGVIINTDNAYPDPNKYIMQLENTYSNIIKLSLISSEFPNTEKVIKNSPEIKKNNKIYWQNLDDGDYVYSIELDSGNYNPSDMTTEINNKIFAGVPRINPIELGDTILKDTAYTNKNYIKISINPNSDIVIFTSYKQALLTKPFIDVSPPIDTKGGDFVTAAISYVVTIQHKNHGLSQNDTILISGSLPYFGIPIEIINTEHNITEIIDKDRYKILVEHFNLGSSRVDNGGGSALSIFVPNFFRLRFDYPDTIGKLLGFRNVGQSIAISSYSNIITNKDAYANEPLLDEAGSTKIITNNSLLLSGDNYLLIVCNQIKGIYTSGKIKNAFAKILLNNIPGKILFNSFVDAPIYFHNPIPSLTELEFSFYSPDGELYNFNGLDHSFTLQIVTLAEIPKGTGITSSIGKIT
jgi:hypothetical protein